MAQIFVIGESCTDEFIYCKAVRLAPDYPVPVLQIENKITNPGMAANVFRNIQNKVSDVQLSTNKNWSSILKTRYVHELTNHMFLRVDSVDEVESIDLEAISLNHDLIVISDYNKGFLKESDIEFICNSHPLVFLDTKKNLGEWAEKAVYIKINDFEFRNSQNKITNTLRDKIIHTRGAEGCDFQGKNYPVEKFEVRDTSGAGDSFMAALVIEYLKHNNIIEAIAMANIAATRVVKTRGVGII